MKVRKMLLQQLQRFVLVSLFALLTLSGLAHAVRAEEIDESLFFDDFSDGDNGYIEYGAREAFPEYTTADRETLIVPERATDEAGNSRTVVGLITGNIGKYPLDIYLPKTVKYLVKTYSEKRFVYPGGSGIRSLHMQDLPEVTIFDSALGSGDLTEIHFNENGKLTLRGEMNCAGLTKLCFSKIRLLYAMTA